MPLTFMTYLLATLAIVGFPPPRVLLEGRDPLQAIMTPAADMGLWFAGLCVAGLTAFYMFRQVS